jgi:hypothetical protein
MIRIGRLFAVLAMAGTVGIKQIPDILPCHCVGYAIYAFIELIHDEHLLVKNEAIIAFD